jgi:hypothetical protein
VRVHCGGGNAVHPFMVNLVKVLVQGLVVQKPEKYNLANYGKWQIMAADITLEDLMFSKHYAADMVCRKKCSQRKNFV